MGGGRGGEEGRSILTPLHKGKVYTCILLGIKRMYISVHVVRNHIVSAVSSSLEDVVGHVPQLPRPPLLSAGGGGEGGGCWHALPHHSVDVGLALAAVEA